MPIEEFEEKRLEVLEQYDILDSADEAAFNDITLLASYICQTPIALISLIDRRRQWFKSRIGLDVSETPREMAFCHHAIQQEKVMVVNNALDDARFAQNPLVTKDPNIRFYAGAPITTAEGYALGTICVIDRKPNEISAEQEKALQALARQVMNLLERRREQAEKIRRQKIFDEARERILEKEISARKLAEDSSRLKDDFLATISHELRTPLNAILGWAKLISSGKLDRERTDRAVETIIRSAQSQAQLIDDLLDISRIISGKLRLDVRAVKLQPIIEETIESVRLAAENKSIRIQTVIDSKAAAISGDSGRLQQIIWNLLSNAIKFTPNNGKIHICLKRVNSHLEFSVIDTGKGISPKFLPYVFDRFRQEDASSNRSSAGMGLGLAIVRNLVELHGGTISVESQGENCGSAFTVFLPVKIANELQDNNDSDRVQPNIDEYTPLKLAPMLSGVKVVVIDDEEDARLLVKEMLTQSGAEVTVCKSVAEVVEAIKTDLPQVLISDIGMPKEDGFDLIAKVRALPLKEGAETPAIALTAYTRAEDRVKVLSSGFQMFLTKPFEPAELIAGVKDLSGIVEKLR